MNVAVQFFFFRNLSKLCPLKVYFSASGSQEQLFEQILSGRFSFPPPIWDKISYSAKGLIQGLLQLDVEERFSASQILEYPWILVYFTVFYISCFVTYHFISGFKIKLI